METITLDSSKSSNPSRSGAKYVTKIAQDVFSQTEAWKLDEQAIDRVSDTLFALLGTLVVNYGATSARIYNPMMAFIYEQRGTIATSFRNIYHQTKELRTESSHIRTFGPRKIISSFEDFHLADNLTNDTKVLELPGIENFMQFIHGESSYRWLIDRLRGEMTLPDTDSYILDEIRSVLSSKILPTQMTPAFSVYVDVTFTLDWDILAFARAQGYDPSDDNFLANTITITGSSTDAQALSCRDYMDGIWPHTGQRTIALFQNMLRNGRRHEEYFHSSSFLQFSATIAGRSVIIKASGIPEFLVELAEQIAWLGAALQPSPPGTGVFHIKPWAKHTGSSMHPKKQRSEDKFTIKYKVENDTAKPQSAKGRCWHDLFVNPIVVRGFPIPGRCETGTGLEVPLDMLVALAGARYIDTFQSKVFIKGFSTMLIPTKQSGDLLCWHLLSNFGSKKRISYLDCASDSISIEMNTLEHYRHVLGWCSDALSISGTTRANYDIRNSRLPQAHSGCTLEKASISTGKFVTGTASFSLGNREKAVHISRDGYLTKLQWISTKYFIFWDEGEKRGWLVNGTSTLLHILRKSIDYSRQKLQSAWLLDPNELKDALGEPRSNKALEVLINDKNRGLKLYLDRSEVYDEHTNDQQISRFTSRRQTRYYRLEDQIEYIYNILEKLIDSQTDAERRSGLEMKMKVHRQLEGWDFKDLATGGDPFFPRVTQLQVMGKGWVDFTKALHAVTLFGRGFGDLIQPQFGREKTPRCSLWSVVPSNKYYLAACISDLEEIMENNGDPDSKPRKLCENVDWYMNQTTHSVCPCTKGHTHKHHDPVQILFPRKFMTNIENAPQVKLETHGAVIFGYNISIGWLGVDPSKSQTPQELGDATDASSSRAGSSIPSSPTPAARSSTPTHSLESPLSTPDITPPNILKRTYGSLHNILPTNRKKRKSSPEAEGENVFISSV